MLVAGACWLYPLGFLGTSGRDWLCPARFSPSLLRRDGCSHPGTGLPASPSCGVLAEKSLDGNVFRKPPFTPPLRDVSLYSGFFGSTERTAVFAIVTLGPAFAPWTCHRCPSGQVMVKQKCRLFFPRERLVSKELGVQGARWSCLVRPSGKNRWEKGACGSCAQLWCGPAAGRGGFCFFPNVLWTVQEE